jgi:hypothetical protein
MSVGHIQLPLPYSSTSSIYSLLLLSLRQVGRRTAQCVDRHLIISVLFALSATSPNLPSHSLLLCLQVLRHFRRPSPRLFAGHHGTSKP